MYLDNELIYYVVISGGLKPHQALNYRMNLTIFSFLQVFRKLQKLIGVRHELEAGFYWSIVRRSEDPSNSISRMYQTVENNSKIAVAYAVMDECFVPIIDQRSGINLIHNVVYNCG